MRPIQGQWYYNQLLRQFIPDLECFKLMDDQKAEDYRLFYKLHQDRLKSDADD